MDTGNQVQDVSEKLSVRCTQLEGRTQFRHWRKLITVVTPHLLETFFQAPKIAGNGSSVLAVVQGPGGVARISAQREDFHCSDLASEKL
jgi:hypothetical protein